MITIVGYLFSMKSETDLTYEYKRSNICPLQSLQLLWKQKLFK